MSEKSYVALVQDVCPICGEKTDSGVAIDRRLRNSLPRTVQQWGLCPEHKDLFDRGFVALVECSNGGARSYMNPENAIRTGQLAHVKEEVFTEVFNVPVPEGKMCFVEVGVIDKLRSMTEGEGE